MIKFKLLYPEAFLLPPQKEGDVGYDISCCFQEERMVILPGHTVRIPSGVAIHFPPGVWGRIAPRSSAATKRGLLVVDGTIDNGYRGEIGVVVCNPGRHPAYVEKGAALAQITLHRKVVIEAFIQQTEEEFDEDTDRGTDGFGSTGR